MNSSHLQAYRNVSFNTATPPDILLALYDGLLRYTHAARQCIARRDPANKGAAINSALAILTELNSTLDHEKAPELCQNLQRLYDYYAHRLQQASVHLDTQPIDEVLRHLQSLRDTWAQAVQISGSSSRAAP